MMPVHRTEEGVVIPPLVVWGVMASLLLALLTGGSALVVYVWDDRASDHEHVDVVHDEALKDLLERNARTLEAYEKEKAARAEVLKAEAVTKPRVQQQRADVFETQADTNRATALAIGALTERLEQLSPPGATPAP